MRRPFEPQLGRDFGIIDETDRIARGGTRVAAEQPPDLTLGGAAIDRVLCPRDAPLQARQRWLYPLAEAGMHGLVLLLPLVRTHQQERLAAARTGPHPRR